MVEADQKTVAEAEKVVLVFRSQLEVGADLAVAVYFDYSIDPQRLPSPVAGVQKTLIPMQAAAAQMALEVWSPTLKPLVVLVPLAWAEQAC